jgi:hypothetical protein
MGVFGQRFDAAGSPMGGEFQVNTYTTNWQQFPDVATDDSGKFAAVWDSDGQDGSERGVFGRWYDATGTPVGPEFELTGFTTNSQSRPAVAANGSGEFVVVWQSDGQDTSSNGVFGRRFDSVGTPLGSAFQVNSYTTGSQWMPAVALDNTGQFVVAWIVKPKTAQHGAFGRWFDSLGATLWPEFQVSSYTTGQQNFPAVAADSEGTFVVTWTSYTQDGDGWGVFGQLLADAIFVDGFDTSDACAWSAAVGGGCP